MARTYHDRPAHVVAVGAGESERGDHSASDRDGRPAVPAVVDVGVGQVAGSCAEVLTLSKAGRSVVQLCRWSSARASFRR